MKAILYVSQAEQAFDANALTELLQQAQERNQSVNVTGYLYFKAPYFFQYLESEADEAAEIMASIEKDPRHKVMAMFSEEFEGNRRFGEWSMKFINQQGLPRLILEQVIIDDMLSMNDEVYRNEERWQKNILKMVATIARNQQQQAQQPRQPM
ncbi:BLUF domain-containing protein [Gilvimarinus sp. DA14]|uniref:BLUF domain-containing protein n=1 Tax=Gilvimarinus sp. DA14 TaxID=2956798 RepID=UPI0020B8425E|nr:BLUF domain-containing protein [Gilvimarinus sp. DA14]UTF59163.1 BLUF domain-containing protein [Gilvimarinus sp. DA14]